MARYCLSLQKKFSIKCRALIELSVIGTLCFSVAFGWNPSAFAVLFERVNDPFMRIEGFVCNQGIGSDLSQQNLSTLQIMS